MPMGRLMSTGVGRAEHSTKLIYEGVHENQKCFMVCECDWRIEITAFKNYGGVIETRSRYDEHLDSVGLQRLHPKPQPLTINDDPIKLSRLHRRSSQTDDTND